MITNFVPKDQDQRKIIESNLDETLFVEAGAGTGKTEILVKRIVSLIATGRATINSIAAITFTDLAAAELRERVRDELLSRAKDETYPKTQKQKCYTAIREFASSSIQTLHSFSGQLLRERPLDIGLPPSFEVTGTIESDLNFQERWEVWLNETLNSEDSMPALTTALKLGLRLNQLRDIASSFHEHYDIITQPFPNIPIPEPETTLSIIEAKKEIQSLLPLANLDNDPLLLHAREVIGFADRLERLGHDSDISLNTLSHFKRLSFTKGKQSDWDIDPKTGANGCTSLKKILSELEKLRTNEFESLRTGIICEVLESIRQLAIQYAEERVVTGKIEFHDLLVLARNLLRDEPSARTYFQNRFTHILIDEFQDTDPVQMEIALLLASDNLTSTISITETSLVPGKLFVVGDPKQSIYLFRGADVSVSEDFKIKYPDLLLSLTQNFRSQRPIISWTNHLFEQWMQQDSDRIGQVTYQPIYPQWNSQSDNSMGVKFIGFRTPGNISTVRQVEATAIGNLVRLIKKQKWPIREGVTGRLRTAKYDDICLLSPTRTGIEVLESVLTRNNVPYRIESQSMVLASQDVQDIINCLRAIDSPTDQIALVAALRSFVFAHNDSDLLDFIRSGGTLNCVNPASSPGPVQQSLDLIGKFYDLRLWISPEELIERFIRETRLVESCFSLKRPRGRWRRLRFLIDRAAAFSTVGSNSLRSYLDWIERQAEEGARMLEAPVPEPDEDAIRIMTIHAAKGLEFPIVILAGLGSRPRSVPGTVIYDRKSLTAEVNLAALGKDRFATPGYQQARDVEKDKIQAERTRQLYVAATRPRDHLIVSLFRPESKEVDSSFGGMLEQKINRDSNLWDEIPVSELNSFEEKFTEPTPVIRKIPIDSSLLRESWLSKRREQIRIGSLPSSIGATRIAKTDKDVAEDEEIRYRSGRGGASLGRAVHNTLQSVDLSTGASINEISKAQSVVEGIPSRWKEIADLSRVAINSKIVKEAVASQRYYREVYVGVPIQSLVLEGFIDLVFESDDGLVVIDYKTDSIETGNEIASLMDRYRLQGGSYALALEQASGKFVSKIIFLFLHNGSEVIVEDLPGAIYNVKQIIRQYIS